MTLPPVQSGHKEEGTSEDDARVRQGDNSTLASKRQARVMLVTGGLVRQGDVNMKCVVHRVTPAQPKGEASCWLLVIQAPG